MDTSTHTDPVSLLVCALGGEGGGVLTGWIVEAARIAGHPVQATSIPGVAQRTGATTYYIEVSPLPAAALGGRRPVFSLSPVPGALDLLVSSELLETTRQVAGGMTAPQRTLVVSSVNRALTTQERMQPGDGRADTAALLRTVRGQCRELQVLDMAALARECGTAISAVMLGAVAASGLLPMRREHYEQAVRAAGGAGAEASLRGFARALELLAQTRQHADLVQQLLSDQEHESVYSSRGTADSAAKPPPEAAQHPASVSPVLALGHARLLEYQDEAYAALYLRRLDAVLQAERTADPQGAHGHATTAEMARWLALWMAYDDIVRVADLKSRASRAARVRGEVKAGAGDILRVWDHFKPGVPEFAALLPPALAQRLLAWDRRRVAAGREPWALPLKVGTHTVGGMLALRLLASLRWLRVRGSRHAAEQAMIERWLAAVVDGTRRGWALGHEIALCGRLIKGYGSTNEKGKETLLHVLEHLATIGDAQAAARAVRAAREAALADDAGRALDATLAAHGAPPRPVQAQPIRFMRKPRAA